MIPEILAATESDLVSKDSTLTPVRKIRLEICGKIGNIA